MLYSWRIPLVECVREFLRGTPLHTGAVKEDAIVSLWPFLKSSKTVKKNVLHVTNNNLTRAFARLWPDMVGKPLFATIVFDVKSARGAAYSLARAPASEEQILSHFSAKSHTSAAIP